MEYENVDEAIAFQTACKKVKQIANTIKLIRMKYYPNFARISDEDKKTYDSLHAQIDRVAEENGLTKLKIELMADIEDRFNDDIQPKEGEEPRESPESSEKILKAYYGAIDAGKQALSEGRLKKALNCQKQANSYMSQLEALQQSGLVEMAIHYKREMFADLSVEQQKTQGTNWREFLKSTYREGDLQERNHITGEILQQVKAREEKEQIGQGIEEKNTQEMLLET